MYISFFQIRSQDRTPCHELYVTNVVTLIFVVLRKPYLIVIAQNFLSTTSPRFKIFAFVSLLSSGKPSIKITSLILRNDIQRFW